MENIVRKGEIACNKQFLLFSQCFLPYMAHIFQFKCTLECICIFFFNLDQSKILSSGNGLNGNNHVCYKRPLLHACLLLNPKSSVVMVLAFGARGLWFEFRPNHIFLPYIYPFVSLLRTLFVRWGLVQDWPKSHYSHLMSKKWTFCLISFLSINDDFMRGCVMGDHSFMHGCFQI